MSSKVPDIMSQMIITNGRLKWLKQKASISTNLIIEYICTSNPFDSELISLKRADLYYYNIWYNVSYHDDLIFRYSIVFNKNT